MNTEFNFIIRILNKELWDRLYLAILVHILVAIIFASLAWFWPQVYTSSATVIIDDKNILDPLLEGTAVTSEVADPTKMARQVMSSRKTLKEIVSKKVWQEGGLTAEETEKIIDKVRSKTQIISIGRNILQISYQDSDPDRAFLTAKWMTGIFIRESQETKLKQSRSAFEFIESQADIYHDKLTYADQAIKEFQEKNIDSTPGSKELANERILSLKRQIEETEIEMSGASTRLLAQRNQLSG